MRLRRPSVFLACCLFALAARAAFADAVDPAALELLKPGTTLPVTLRHALRPGKTAVGTRVVAITTQRVPIGPTLWLQHGAHLSGSVISSSRQGATETLAIRFDSLSYHGRTISLAADAVAVASGMDVSATAAPVNGGPDRGNADPASWTTAQVGGDEVYRSGWQGPVCDSSMRTVGFADFHGVYSLPSEQESGPGFPLAMGPFSTSAKGLYGFDEHDVLHSANGVVEIQGPSGKVQLRDGDNMLLKVIGQ